MPVQSHAQRGRGKDSFLPPHCRSCVRCKPALLAEARWLFYSGSAHRVDRQNGFKGLRFSVPLVSDNLPFGRANLADLFALLPMAASVAATGRMDLSQTARTATAPWA